MECKHELMLEAFAVFTSVFLSVKDALLSRKKPFLEIFLKHIKFLCFLLRDPIFPLKLVLKFAQNYSAVLYIYIYIYIYNVEPYLANIIGCS